MMSPPQRRHLPNATSSSDRRQLAPPLIDVGEVLSISLSLCLCVFEKLNELLIELLSECLNELLI
jgi:hypothetical protein